MKIPFSYLEKNSLNLEATNSILSSDSSGYIGKDKHVSARVSETGKSPFLYPKSLKQVCKCNGIG